MPSKDNNNAQTIGIMQTKSIKVIPCFHTDDYWDRINRNGYTENTCECCGRKLNPKTMKGVQMLTTAEYTDEVREVKHIVGESDGAMSQGLFFFGPKCYKEIRARLAATTTTRIVEL